MTYKNVYWHHNCPIFFIFATKFKKHQMKIINFCVNLVQKYLPEPFVLAILLTFIAAITAMPICHQTPVEVVEHWGNGVWGLLAFSMQMSLILVCGATFAGAPAVKKGINKIAELPKTPAAAIATVTLVSAVACWLNWGFGLIVGVILAKEIARVQKGVDYRLLIASAYSGFVVWHAGLSGSIPLTMATAGEALTNATNGALTDPVSISSTIFAPQNLLIVLLVIVSITVANTMMHPKDGSVVCVDPQLLYEKDETPVKEDSSPAAKLEQSRLLSVIVSLLGFSYLFIKIVFLKGSVDLNAVIMLFLFTGILFHGTPAKYVKAFTKSAGSAAGIILQFPFYAGIMGIITGVGSSGICYGTLISDACIKISTPTTFPLLTFLCAAVLNLFVPSGGGHWAIQAPVMFTAGADLGVDPGLTGIAIAWGDAWTNLIQPFWALPALAIAKLNAKDIMGFCLIDLIITGVIICSGLLIWAGCFN